jgi:hypothetical protein
MTLGEQRRKALELLAPPLGRSIQMEKQLIEKISDGVATLTFNRPDRLNALSTSAGMTIRSNLLLFQD